LLKAMTFLPIPIRAHRRIGLRHRQRLFRHCVEAETRRQHQPLLRAADWTRRCPRRRARTPAQRARKWYRPINSAGLFCPVHGLADFERRGEASRSIVSLCTTITALILWLAIGRKPRLRSAPHSAPRRQSPGRKSTSELEFLGKCQATAPQIGRSRPSATLSPGDSVFTNRRLPMRRVPRRRIDHYRLPGAGKCAARPPSPQSQASANSRLR